MRVEPVSVPVAAPSGDSRSHEPVRLRVLLVPDSIHWITGTIARSIVEHNPWIDGTIISGPVLEIVAREKPFLFDAFDLVHFVCPYASRGWLPRLRDRLPVVTSHHHVSDEWELQRHNLDGDAIVVGSLQWAEDVEKRGADPERVVCIPYGVDASRFVPGTQQEQIAIRKSLGIAPDAIVVGFFAKRSSNERDRKGTDIFAAAVQALSCDLPRLAVLIIGPGWNELVAQLVATGVTCIWQPFVRDAAEMPRMYRALDFYWVTARVEGGPVTLLEAMSTALCCITTPVGLAKQIIDDGVNGVVVPFDEVHAFVRHTLSLAAAPEHRANMGTGARATILEQMDVPVTAQGVRKAYEIATTHFEARTRNPHVPRVASYNPVTTLAPALLLRIGLLEQLVWSEALMLQQQRPMAFRIIAEEWMRHPLSSLPPRFLFRNILPPQLVRVLVRARHAVAGSKS